MHFERNKVQLECYDELVTCVLKMWPDFALICHIMAWDFVMLLHDGLLFILQRN